MDAAEQFDHDGLVHLCTRAEWERAQESGERIPDGFDADGFVHLSTPVQVHLPANRLFAGRDDLVLLVLDPTRLDGEVRFEPGVPSDPASMLFPHLYGRMTTAAVVVARPYLPGADGTFAPLVPPRSVDR